MLNQTIDPSESRVYIVTVASPDLSQFTVGVVEVMSEIKGILLNAWVKFVNDRFGQEAVASRCL